MPFSIAADVPDPAELVELYRSVGWTAYTEDPGKLVDAVNGSHTVLAARAESGELIGLARTISDGHTIAYLQDILVAPAHHRRGVATYEDVYKLTYLRGPSGILVMLAQELKKG